MSDNKQRDRKIRSRFQNNKNKRNILIMLEKWG